MKTQTVKTASLLKGDVVMFFKHRMIFERLEGTHLSLYRAGCKSHTFCHWGGDRDLFHFGRGDVELVVPDKTDVDNLNQPTNEQIFIEFLEANNLFDDYCNTLHEDIGFSLGECLQRKWVQDHMRDIFIGSFYWGKDFNLWNKAHKDWQAHYHEECVTRLSNDSWSVDSEWVNLYVPEQPSEPRLISAATREGLDEASLPLPGHVQGRVRRRARPATIEEVFPHLRGYDASEPQPQHRYIDIPVSTGSTYRVSYDINNRIV